MARRSPRVQGYRPFPQGYTVSLRGCYGLPGGCLKLGGIVDLCITAHAAVDSGDAQHVDKKGITTPGKYKTEGSRGQAGKTGGGMEIPFLPTSCTQPLTTAAWEGRLCTIPQCLLILTTSWISCLYKKR